MTRSAFLTLAALLLAACGTVAPEAPALLPLAEVAARTEGAADASRGEAAAQGLQGRAASLQARAARLRRAGIASGERSDLLRRADELQRDTL